MLYGCMKIGGDWSSTTAKKKDFERASQILTDVWEAGYRRFDHADIYCRTKAEQVFGHWFSESGLKRTEIYLQSKCGIILPDDPNLDYTQNSPGRYDYTPSYLERTLDGILTRLNTDYLDALLLHRPDMLMQPKEVALTLNKFIKDGRVKKLGVSNYSVTQIALLNRFLETPIEINQVEFNPLFSDLIACWMAPRQKQAQEFDFFHGLYERTFESELSLQAYSPFGGGLIRKPSPDGPARFDTPLTRTVTTIAKERSQTFEEIVIAWINTLPAKIEPVIGSVHGERLRNCKKAEKTTLTHPEWYRIFNAGRQRGVP